MSATGTFVPNRDCEHDWHGGVYKDGYIGGPAKDGLLSSMRCRELMRCTRQARSTLDFTHISNDAEAWAVRSRRLDWFAATDSVQQQLVGPVRTSPRR